MSVHRSLGREIKAASLAKQINILHTVTFLRIIHKDLQTRGLVVSFFFILKFYILVYSCQPACKPVISIKTNFIPVKLLANLQFR